jgi:hypothetical protein
MSLKRKPSTEIDNPKNAKSGCAKVAEKMEAETQAKFDDNVDTSDELQKMYECSQISDIAKCFATMHMKMSRDSEEIGKKMKIIQNELTSVKESVEYVQQDVAAMQEEDIPRLERALVAERNERLKLDLWSRKWNLIAKGIPGGTTESRPQTEHIF